MTASTEFQLETETAKEEVLILWQAPTITRLTLEETDSGSNVDQESNSGLFS